MIGTRKNYIFAAGLALALIGFFVSPDQAEAASGPCYFGNNGTCSISGDGAYRTNDIFTNGSSRTSSGAGQAMGGVNTKAEFISYVASRFNNGNAQNKTGAEFVIRTMLDGHAAHQTRPGATTLNTWVDLMQSASVSFQTINGATICNTSWYVPSANNTFFDSYTSGCKTRDIIRIKQNGYVIADIEIACGNMTGRQDRTLRTWRMAATSVAKNNAGANITGGTIDAGQAIYWTHVVQFQTVNPATDGKTSVDIAGKIQWGGSLGGTYGSDPTYNREFSPGDSISRSGSYTTTGADVGKLICQRITGNNTAYNDLSSFASGWACVTVVNSATCSAVIGPAQADGSSPALSFITTGSSTGAYTLTMALTGEMTASQTKSFATGNASVSETFIFAPPAGGFPLGSYTATATYSPVGGTARSCSTTITVENRPFLSIYGGDIFAGISPNLSNTCTFTANSGVVSWNHDALSPDYDAGDYAGAGTKAAVFASGNIGHFSSGLNIANLKPTGLSFANTSGTYNLTGAIYGGHFAGTPPSGCDFIGTTTPSAIYTANRTLASESLGDNIDKYYLVKGADVYISANITYVNSGTGWAKLTDIPSFKLVVQGGNIYIDKNVNRMDGLYVAIPTSTNTKGEIYTCATSPYTPASKTVNSYATDCATQLKIYGGFAAKKVHFDRTHGTLSKATTTDTFLTDNAAEQFIYTPEMWLPNGSDKSLNISSYQGLPPVL